MPLTRRDWLLQAGAGFGALALLDLLAQEGASASRSRALPHQAPPLGDAPRRPGASSSCSWRGGRATSTPSTPSPS